MHNKDGSEASLVTNIDGQLIGQAIPDWHVPAHVSTAEATQELVGKYCLLEKLEMEHAPALMEAFKLAHRSLWTYLPYGPFQHLNDYQNWIADLNHAERTKAFAYCIKSQVDQQVLGLSAFLRMMPEAGSIEIGHLSFSPMLQKTAAATEAIFLMADAVFSLGYRRLEWKCNDLNKPSVSAARRYGFRYEGTFRQAQVIKGHNRDTAWFSIMDHEWTYLKPCFTEWLATQNFDSNGIQLKRLSELTSGYPE